jgi:release factor glutamine methyltransferase
VSANTPTPNAAAAPATWTILDLLQWTQKHFAEKGIETARLDAECLLAFALGVDRMRLYIDYEKPVSEEERATFRKLVRRRGADRIPVAQIIGRKEFWSLDLRVTADVLTPRPDTETLVSAALGLLPDAQAPVRILDIGTGSGAVALALASERPRAQIVATDVSAAALAVARENAERCGALTRVELRQGALFEPVSGERFDLVVSNPPYLGEADRASLAPELAHEPDGALFAGPQGLELLEPLVRQAPEALVPDGALAVECDPAQADRVAGWCREAGLLSVTKHRDLAGRNRVVAARGGG